MTEAWRIVKEKYARSAFDGEGARRAGGRFNSPGRPVVYTSESLALAELEILGNLGSYVAFRVRIPDEHISELDRSTLPDHWRDDPAPQAVRRIGDRWHQSGRSLALRVSSAVVPSEDNVLINPEHPEIDSIEIDGPFDPEIDVRLR